MSPTEVSFGRWRRHSRHRSTSDRSCRSPSFGRGLRTSESSLRLPLPTTPDLDHSVRARRRSRKATPSGQDVAVVDSGNTFFEGWVPSDLRRFLPLATLRTCLAGMVFLPMRFLFASAMTLPLRKESRIHANRFASPRCGESRRLTVPGVLSPSRIGAGASPRLHGKQPLRRGLGMSDTSLSARDVERTAAGRSRADDNAIRA